MLQAIAVTGCTLCFPGRVPLLPVWVWGPPSTHIRAPSVGSPPDRLQPPDNHPPPHSTRHTKVKQTQLFTTSTDLSLSVSSIYLYICVSTYVTNHTALHTLHYTTLHTNMYLNYYYYCYVFTHYLLFYLLVCFRAHGNFSLSLLLLFHCFISSCSRSGSQDVTRLIPVWSFNLRNGTQVERIAGNQKWFCNVCVRFIFYHELFTDFFLRSFEHSTFVSLLPEIIFEIF